MSLESPDGQIEVQLHATDRLRYDVIVNHVPVLQRATLSLQLEGVTFGVQPTVGAVARRSFAGTVNPPVRQKAAVLPERYNELRVPVHASACVVFRAYNEGVAYRWETTLPQREIKVLAEEAAFNFAADAPVYFPEEASFYSHNERLFQPRAMADLTRHNLASIPAVVAARGVKIMITDADVEDYPGLWLRGTGRAGLAATFPPVALQERLEGDRDLRVTQSADYIAVTPGTRTYPWRVLGVAQRDGDMLVNPLVYLLASPSRVTDTAWIKPGKVAWDWWNANNLAHVDFKAGINTRTYKEYIDFAAENHLDYIILDEGWYRLGNVLAVVPEMNVEELVAYGKQKGVGIILWVVWKTLADQLQPALDQFSRWGVRGLKVDFMQRDDQALIRFYHEVCREAAQRHLLVDFHGAVRPASMTRTWPNLISTEGVRGLEWCKWSSYTDPEHDVTLPFTRMFVGPMDYTPGAMRNAARKEFAPAFDRPMSQGTRCHQLGLYVVFESPLQMLADSPTQYRREPETMSFLGAVPTVWDETRVLDARLGDYVVLARRSGDTWFVGAITDWNRRELEVDLSFLPAGPFVLTQWADGVNADRYAEDFVRSTQRVTNQTRLRLQLAEGGGWAGIIKPEQAVSAGTPR